MTSPIKLRDSLILLLPQIGIYTYQGGATTPAICFDNPPNNISVTKTEVIMPSYPKIPENYHTSDLFHQTQEWCIYFFQHDLSDQGYEDFYQNIDVMYHSWEHITGNPMQQKQVPDSRPGYKFNLMTYSCGDSRNPYYYNGGLANLGGNTY